MIIRAWGKAGYEPVEAKGTNSEVIWNILLMRRRMALNKEISARMAQIAEICERYGVRELSLFGSALGRDMRADSDFDFLVEFRPDAAVGLVRFGQLQEELEAVLGRKVDLVPKSGLKPLIRETVLRQAEPVYAG